MCGLVGVINREVVKADSDKMVKFFNQALFMDTVRGKHGTGISVVNKAGDITSYKKAMHAPDFLDLSYSKSLISAANNVFLSGHNRWATQGSHTDENSHPFKHGKITMFHNGTLDNVSDLPKGRNFIVDSDAIAYSLMEQGVKDTLEALDGAFALVWYDDDSNTLNFARNKERPLFFGTIKGSNSLLYASEDKMLEWIADRNNICLDAVSELPTGSHMVIPLDQNDKTIFSPFIPKPSGWDNYYNDYPYYSTSKVISVAGITVGTTITSVIDSYQPYNSGMTSENSYGKLVGSVISHNISRNVGFNAIRKGEHSQYIGMEVSGKVIALNPLQCNEIKLVKTTSRLFSGPKSSTISKNDYLNLISDGCCCCSKDLSIDDELNIHWDFNETPYCLDCSEELYS